MSAWRVRFAYPPYTQAGIRRVGKRSAPTIDRPLSRPPLTPTLITARPAVRQRKTLRYLPPTPADITPAPHRDETTNTAIR